MSARPGTLRRGIALLLVLATLVLVMAAAVGLVRAASSERLRRSLAIQTAMADELLRAAETPIDDWLTRRASEVVLPVDGRDPQVPVLFDAWAAGELEHELRITAWDQCGMVGHAVARSGSTLRRAVPADVIRLLDRARIERGEPVGLDVFLEHVRAHERVTVFPAPPPADPATFGGMADASPAVSALAGGVDPAEAKDPPAPALGAWVATHGIGSLNVNTAPLDLVEAALRRAGRRGMLERIETARAAGEALALADDGVEDEQSGQRGRSRGEVEFVASSSAWAFRIDVRVGAVRRSWWAVYALSPEAEQPTWECVQRLAISS